jgi:hypothetical protein
MVILKIFDKENKEKCVTKVRKNRKTFCVYKVNTDNKKIINLKDSIIYNKHELSIFIAYEREFIQLWSTMNELSYDIISYDEIENISISQKFKHLTLIKEYQNIYIKINKLIIKQTKYYINNLKRIPRNVLVNYRKLTKFNNKHDDMHRESKHLIDIDYDSDEII